MKRAGPTPIERATITQLRTIVLELGNNVATPTLREVRELRAEVRALRTDVQGLASDIEAVRELVAHLLALVG